ncbi:discoidin domain-containing protein [Kitasatospora cineracea]|uniref:Glucosylceramidase n=1 Tax=Kitasatospora cineracea TaxID=88074 RepID=A0A8G1UET7_9ACTN|nr:discoidin domain-containing protein [Kitasatospora cineracea]ROR37244.1 glucosylceramidase [Kitasatospora cineracea]
MYRRVLGTATATALALGLMGAAPASPHRPTAGVEVWVTTPDGAELLHQRPSVAFQRGAFARTTITVDPGQTFQRMDGFGASITDSSAAVLSGLPPADRDAALRRLFDPAQGIGISMVRQPIGSSDFTAAAAHYTYDDVPAGQSDFALTHFSIAHDEQQILPLLRRARQLDPELTVVATPWSPPAWMKTGDSLLEGKLKDDPAVYDAYARYLVKFVQAYAAAGVPVDYLTVQNEPQNRKPNAYPGTDLTAEQEEKVVEALGPLLKKASPRTRILGYDHNWATHPDDVKNTPPGEDPETDYPYRLLDSDAAKWLAGTAYHCYSGDPSAQSALHDAHPDKGIWFTECSGSHGPTDTAEQTFRGTLTWHARNLTVGATRNWARSVLNWNIALDEHDGPHNGGCGTCTALLTVHDDHSVTTGAEYYTIGHLSKFVRPGAVRIASTSFGTPGWNGQLTDVAFTDPDGSTVLVVHNENDAPRDFAVAVGGQSFAYTLPGGALATFRWPKSGAPKPDRREVPLTGATATARPAAADARAAIDADGSTRWSGGTAQTPGQYLQLDLGRRTAFDRIALDSGDNLGDYARSWKIEASNDGTRWHPLADGPGTGQLTTVDLPRDTRARYLRITGTATAPNWWSLADVRLYR